MFNADHKMDFLGTQENTGTDINTTATEVNRFDTE